MPVGSSYRYVAAATVACSGAEWIGWTLGQSKQSTPPSFSLLLPLSPSTQHYLSDYKNCNYFDNIVYGDDDYDCCEHVDYDDGKSYDFEWKYLEKVIIERIFHKKLPLLQTATSTPPWHTRPFPNVAKSPLWSQQRVQSWKKEDLEKITFLFWIHSQTTCADCSRQPVVIWHPKRLESKCRMRKRLKIVPKDKK